MTKKKSALVKITATSEIAFANKWTSGDRVVYDTGLPGRSTGAEIAGRYYADDVMELTREQFAKTRLARIRAKADQIVRHAEATADDATWGALGDLGHIDTVLDELLASYEG